MRTQRDTKLSMLDLVAVSEGGSAADALAISLRSGRHAGVLWFARYWLAQHQHAGHRLHGDRRAGGLRCRRHAAPDDDEAGFLATTVFRRVLDILHGGRRCLPSPVIDSLAGLRPQERDAIADFPGAAVIGGPQKMRVGLAELQEATQADEVILVCDIFDPDLRLRSLDIAAAALD